MEITANKLSNYSWSSCKLSHSDSNYSEVSYVFWIKKHHRTHYFSSNDSEAGWNDLGIEDKLDCAEIGKNSNIETF